MSDNISKIADYVSKKDLDIILEVNKKAIELETEVAEQNEKIIDLLNDNIEEQKEINEKLDEIKKLSENIDKDIFKIQVLFSAGLISLIIQVIQIIQIFMKK